jgi:hypothetical protein
MTQLQKQAKQLKGENECLADGVRDTQKGSCLLIEKTILSPGDGIRKMPERIGIQEVIAVSIPGIQRVHAGKAKQPPTACRWLFF